MNPEQPKELGADAIKKVGSLSELCETLGTMEPLVNDEGKVYPVEKQITKIKELEDVVEAAKSGESMNDIFRRMIANENSMFYNTITHAGGLRSKVVELVNKELLEK